MTVDDRLRYFVGTVISYFTLSRPVDWLLSLVLHGRTEQIRLLGIFNDVEAK